MVEGLDRLKQKLAVTIPKATKQATKNALRNGARKIAEAARSLAPVDDGDLKESIDFTFGEYKADNSNVRGFSAGSGTGDKDSVVFVHAGDEKAYYAAFVEFGTDPHPQGGKFKGTQHPGTSPKPFFYPAYRANIKNVRSNINAAVRRATKKAAKS